MEDEQKLKKLEAGKAKLAEYRQRKAQADGQKKQKKKKKSVSTRHGEHAHVGTESEQAPGEESSQQDAGRAASGPSTFTISRTLRSGDTVTQDHTYTIEPDSEVSTTAEDYTSEVNGSLEAAVSTDGSSRDLIREEDTHLSASHSEHKARAPPARETHAMEDELVAKPLANEEPGWELQDESSAAHGSEEMQQLHDFEAALRQRDGIITQLTANLQQARREKDDIMREFLVLTEQSQNLQIQFQQLQAGETLRNSSHTSTAADLLQARQQIISYQQQLEDRELQLRDVHRQSDEQLRQISKLQERVQQADTLAKLQEESMAQKLMEKENSIAEQERILAEQESTVKRLEEELGKCERSLKELAEQVAAKDQDMENLRAELSGSKQKERMSSGEIKQLMGTVEGLQKRIHQGNLPSEGEQRMEPELRRRMDQLRAELDEMYGQQIVQMKQELRLQHAAETDRLVAQHRLELEQLRSQSAEHSGQVSLLNLRIGELEQKLRETQVLKEKTHQELLQVAKEKLNLQSQVEDLVQDMRFARGKVQRASQSITDQEHKLSEVGKLHATITDLQGQLAAAAEATRELETKHESEVTNYKIKLEMLEREKDAVLDRMAESQEAELDRLRTQLLFSHEEELTKLREDLQRDGQVAVHNLRDELALRHEQALVGLEKSLEEKLQLVTLEKERLAAEREVLLREISETREEMSRALESSRAEEKAQRLQELQTELQELRTGKCKKSTLEREVQELLRKNELLETQRKETEVSLGHRIKELESENVLLKEAKEAVNKRMESSASAEKRVEALARENKELNGQLAELKEEIQRQENTFSFAEKNFEVNYQELKEEYTCLVKVKAELEERILRGARDDEANLRGLQVGARTLRTGKGRRGDAAVEMGKAGMMDEDSADGGEVIEKDTTELMEKLEVAQREKQELCLKLSEVSAQLAARQDETERLRDELRLVKEESQQVVQKYGELQREWEAREEGVRQLGEKQQQHHQHQQEQQQQSQPLQTPESLQTSAAAAVQGAESGLCSVAGHHLQIKALETKVSALKSSLLAATREREQAQQQRLTLALENEALSARLRDLKGQPAAQPPVLANLQADRDQLQRQLDALRGKQLGFAELVQHKGLVEESLHGKLEEKEKALIAAEQEIRTLKERLRVESEPEVSLEKQDEEKEEGSMFTAEERDLPVAEAQSGVEEVARGAGGRGDEARQQLQLSQDELRLQMEAQRISLTQISAAQLELLRETLHAEKETSLRTLTEELEARHAQELSQLQEKHQQELKDMEEQQSGYGDEPRSSKQQKLIGMVTEDCKQLILSFAQVLGEDYLQPLQYKHTAELKTSLEGSGDGKTGKNGDSSSLLREAKELLADLQTLKDGILQEYSRLADLQAMLNTDCNKLEELHTAYDELKRRSEDEIRSLREQLDRASTSAQDSSHLQDFQQQRSDLEQQHGQELQRLRGEMEQHHGQELQRLRGEMEQHHGQELQRLRGEMEQHHGQELQRLRGEMEQHHGQELQRLHREMDQQHGQEQQRLRSHYQQQAKDVEERYTTELLLLKQRLHELSGQPFSASSETHLSVHKEPQSSEDLKAEDVDPEVVLRSPKTAGLTQQLQVLRRALYAKYLQEVTALKEQHSAELERLEARLGEQHRAELQAVREELSRPDKHDPEGMNGEDRSIEGPGAEEQGAPQSSSAVEQQHRERIEEEIAKVIVQMSVEFAQQTELARINRQARESAPGLQALCGDLEGELEAQGNAFHGEMGPGQEPGMPRDTERRLLEEKEELENVLRERTADVLSLRERLRQMGSTPLMVDKECQAAVAQSVSSDHLDHPGLGTSFVILQKETGEGRGCQEASPEEATLRETRGDSEGPADVITAERDRLREANVRLRQVLCDVLKTTAAAEETIGRHVEGLLSPAIKAPPQLTGTEETWGPNGTETRAPHGTLNRRPAGDTPAEPCGASQAGGDDGSVWSRGTESDEGLEMSRGLLPGGLLSPTGLEMDTEEAWATVSSRLQAAVEKLLEAITKTTNQLEHARVTETELMRESFRHNAEINELMHRQEELQERLAEESKAREQLALELHRAEGLIDGYTDERTLMSQQVCQKEELLQHLEEELRVTGSRLQELEQERQLVQQERELLSRQQDAMRDGAGPRELCLVEAAVDAAPEADLLEETEKLMQEKVEVQRQAEKENGELLQQVQALEQELEEQVNRAVELEQARAAETSDLQQQIQALEKQLDKNRKFLDEQAIDREHERDVFQQEIQKLEQQLRSPQKLQPSSEQRNREMEQLASQLRDKSDQCNELLLRNEQLHRDVQERNEEIEKQGSRVRELEQALITSTEGAHQAEEGRRSAPAEAAGETTLEAQLQTEREALDRKEKEISNLEEQLEQFREELENKIEEVQQLHMQMEIQRKELSTQRQDLESKNTLLQNEVASLKQPPCASDLQSGPDHRSVVSKLSIVAEDKDQEIARLNEQIFKLQQLENMHDNKALEQKDELLRELQAQVECLHSEQERLKHKSEEEVEQLNDVIEKLQHELSQIEHQAPKEDVPDSEDHAAPQRPLHTLGDRPEKGCVEEAGLDRAELQRTELKLEQTTRELEALRADHSALAEEHQRLQEQRDERMAQLEEALQERTATLLVVQAEIRAVEQSANARVADLDTRVEELEVCVGEKDSELGRCRQLVEEAQAQAEALQQEVQELRDTLREKVAAALVSQAQLGALQQQTDVHSSELHSQIRELQAHHLSTRGEASPKGAEDPPSPANTRMELQGREAEEGEQAGAGLSGLMRRLKELEANLSQAQQDQDLQRQLLLGSEEDVAEYEERLALLQDILRQMNKRGDGKQEASESVRADVPPAGDSELVQELQEARAEAAATKEQLNTYRERTDKLREELQMRELTNSQLQDELRKASEVVRVDAPSAADSELVQELQKARDEAAATKEQLNSYRERTDKLREELQMRELTISQLQDEHRKASEVVRVDAPSAADSELVQELQKARDEAAATKEQLKSYRERTDKLREELQMRELTNSQLQDELRKASEVVRVDAPSAADSELVQELQKARDEAAATKEELNSYRESTDKLREELQVRDLTVTQLQQDLQQVKEALAKSEEKLALHMRQVPQETTEKPGRSSTKDKPALVRKNSTSQTDAPALINGGFQTLRVVCQDAETQADLRGPGPDSAAEMAEVIDRYTEKIGQMQDLHAAEIMDMETRHISESEILKRDTQVLREECKALGALVERLSAVEGVALSRLEHPVASQLKDGYTSDSSSDWSQRMGYDLLPQAQEFRGTPEGARRDNESPQIPSEMLPDRIKSLLREVHQEGMQVLSLSELPVAEAGDPAGGELLGGWLKEREALLDTIESLKVLITKMQAHRDSGGSAQDALAGGGEDWQGELLYAVRQVFVKERVVLRSVIRTHLEQLDTSDTIVLLNQLERRLAEQDSQFREALEELQSVDRRSLLMELQQLRARLHSTESAQGTQGTAHTGSQGTPGTVHTGAQQLPTARSVEGGQAALDPATGGAAEPQDALHSERVMLTELRNELAQTRLELESTLRAQHKHLKELEALRAEVSGRAAEVDRLSDTLAGEQKRSRELQWALEKEKCKTERQEEQEKEELEDLRLTLEESKGQVRQLSASLEQERQAVAELRQRAGKEQAEQGRLSGEQGRVLELEVLLEAERARARELGGALERERECRRQQSLGGRQQEKAAAREAGIVQAETGCSQVEEGVEAMEELLESLQSQLEEKQQTVLRLVGELERHKLEAVQAARHWEEERQAQAQVLSEEQEAGRRAREEQERLRGVQEELRHQLDRGREQLLRLQQERDGLRDRVCELQAAPPGTELPSTELPSTELPSTEPALWRVDAPPPSDRTRDWVLQQKMAEAPTPGSSAASLSEVARGKAAPTDARHLDSIVQRLQLMAAKITALTSRTSGMQSEGEEDGTLVWLQNSVQDVVSQLQQLPTFPAVPETAPVVSGSSSSLTDRLLRQNAELTGFVSRLTEEKNDLRNSLIRLEEELRRYRQSGAADSVSHVGSSHRMAVEPGSSTVVLQSSEQEAWERERSRLEKALRQAEAEVSRLRGELRTDSLYRDMTGSDSDNGALKRVYGKYLRAESFRKALVYQKKYLLLLLGGFQECEEATLSLIARMGGRPPHSGMELLCPRGRGFSRFRSAVRVSIALSRMKFLVRRWQRATGSGMSASINRNGFGQITGNELRADSPYLHPGGLEVYTGERRPASRGRTGRESPRSTLSVQHRYHTVTVDAPSPLTCSHLQNYDPDRALTDYISRLEALQRRLGSVQSGSTSNAQLHYGIRR
ncbi:A-kinase anchor protein 9 isoform X3 [Amia ocellicauda]|uniref:A-kinase anchor protein 9 isoform X3 n=1 Tax=Amia ocellicauda TaxID=2972642 RepID=UPI003464266D